MEIPLSLQLRLSPTRQFSGSEGTVQDACFHYNSQCLLEGKKSKSLEKHEIQSGYEGSFRVVLQGYAEKKTLNSNWQTRYFVLTPFRLLYYLDSEMKELKGCFNLAGLTQHDLQLRVALTEVALVVQAEKDGQITERVLLTMHVTQEVIFEQWVTNLKRVLNSLSNIPSLLLAQFPTVSSEELLQQNQKFGRSNANFWNRLTISSGELFRYASHLDIIFLRSKNPISYVHRFFMRSYYDHVAILIKDESERVFLFESVQSKGVCLSSLESLLNGFHEQYEEMGYRKLVVEDAKKLELDHLQTYINSLIGRKYELSIGKLLMGNETDCEEDSSKENVDPVGVGKAEKTYFCSELIADIYLKFGILAGGKSNEFWPKDFQENEVMLSEDFRLSPLMRVEIGVPDCSEGSERD